MGRTKGGTNRTWKKEDKLRIVRRYLEEGIGQNKLAEQENISRGMLCRWIKVYLTQGESGLENKGKTGNRFSALHTSKTLSEVDRLKLTIAKQEIEIERLKKGYQVKGVGASKEFISINNVNMKSSED